MDFVHIFVDLSIDPIDNGSAHLRYNNGPIPNAMIRLHCELCGSQQPLVACSLRFPLLHSLSI